MISSVDARTEQVSFVASNPGFVAFDLRGFRFGNAKIIRSSCLEGSFSPTQGATVTYHDAGDGLAILVAAPPGRPAGVAEALPDMLANQVVIVLDRRLCGGSAHRRFAIAGPAVVGSDYQGEGSPVLLSGRITLSARSGTGLLADRREVASLYPAGAFELPAGSRLRECRAAGAESANWWGFVDAASAEVDSQDATVAMSAHLITDAERLALSTPAGTGGTASSGCGGETDSASDRRA